MANNYGVANTTFKPFSFEEMLKPALMATEAHNQLEEQISNLEIIAGELEHKITNNPKDKALKELYNKYKTELRNASDALAANGLNSDSRKVFNKLKSQYSANFSGIEEAYKALVAHKDYLNKLAITHPEIIIEGAGDSLSDFMNGNSPQLKSVNLEDIETTVAKLAKAEAVRNVRFGDWTKDARGKLLTQINKIGLNSEELNQALVDYVEGNTNNPYAALVGNIYEQGINMGVDLKDSKNLERVVDSVLRGLQTGFSYSEDRKSIQNPGYGKTPAKKTPPIDPRSLNNHDASFLLGLDGNISPEYLNLMKKINSNSDFFGNNGENPMRIYENYRDEVSSHGGDFLLWFANSGLDFLNNDPEGSGFVTGDKIPPVSPKEDTAKKYGNVQILTEDEYNMLKTLGYTSDSRPEDFANYEEKLNDLVVATSPSRVGLDDYDNYTKHMQSAISNWVEAESAEKYMFKYSNGRKGEPLDGEDYTDAKILDVSYSIVEPEMIIAKTDKGTILINPYALSDEIGNDVTRAVNAIKTDGSKENKQKVQEITTYILRQRMRDFHDTGTGIKDE